MFTDEQESESESFAKRWAETLEIFYSGDLEGSLYRLKKFASEGYEQAYLELGNLYELRRNGDEDLVKAEYWYQKSITSNASHPAAHLGLGRIYLQSDCPETQQKAFQQFQEVRDCEVGALFGLGEMYFRGLGVNQDYARALEYFELAASQGHIVARARILRIKAKNSGFIGRVFAWIKGARYIQREMKKLPDTMNNAHPLLGISTTDQLYEHNKSFKRDALTGAP